MTKIKFLSQRDQRWKNKKLGFGSVTIGLYGCAITSCCVVLSEFGINVTPDILNELVKEKNGFWGSTKNLLDWAVLTKIYSFLKYVGRFDYDENPADLNKLNNFIDRGIPVILKVGADEIGGRKYHFLVCYRREGSRYRVCDVWDGSDRWLDDRYSHNQSKRPEHIILGFRIFDIIENNMPNSDKEELQEFLKHFGVKDVAECRTMMDKELAFLDAERTKNETLVEENRKLLGSATINKETIEDLKTEVKVLETDVGSCETAKQKARDGLKDITDQTNDILAGLAGTLGPISKLDDLRTALKSFISSKDSELDSKNTELEVCREKNKRYKKLLDEKKEVIGVSKKKLDYGKLWEGVKEPLRLFVCGLVGWLLTEVLNIESVELKSAVIGAVTLILKGSDKALHEYGKLTDKKILGLDLVKGLVRF